MVDSLNLNNLQVDDNGRVNLSGIGSGIDFEAAVDNIIAARRIPVDRLETKVEENTEKLAAFSELTAQLNTLQQSLDLLRGRISFGGEADIFESKEVFAVTSRSDGGTASPATNLIGVSVTNAAEASSHTLEILQVATAHKLASATAASDTDDLGLAFGGTSGSIAGAFTINGRIVDVSASDSLIDLADRINTANTGQSASGVSASIVSVDAGQNILVLTADDTGKAIEIAKLHRVASDQANSATDDLGLAFGGASGSISGSFDLNGTTITVAGTDSLESLAATINAADAGATAKVISDGVNHRLAITSSDPTADVAITNETNNVLSDLGVSLDGGASFQHVLSDSQDVLSDLGISSDGGTTFLNELRQAQSAQFTADGLLDTRASRSAAFASDSNTLGSQGVSNGNLVIDIPSGGPVTIANVDTFSLNGLATEINTNQPSLAAAGITASVIQDADGNYSLEIRQSSLSTTDEGGILDARPTATTDDLALDADLVFDFDGGNIATIDVNPGDSLDDVVNAINTDPNLIAAGVTASAVAEGSGFRLVVQHDATLTATAPTELALSRPAQVFERESNTIDDVLDGVTLTLFQEEVGTEIKLDIEQNLSGVKETIFSFVESYNAVRSFINQQQLTDPATGGAAEDSGALFANPALSNVEQRLSGLIGQGATGISEGLQVLSEIGIDFVDNQAVGDPLLADTLQIDETVLDEALLNQPDEVRRLFGFDFSVDDPRVAILNFTGNTTAAQGGYTLDITYSGGQITGATINGVANSVTVDGNVLTATDATGAEGLTFIYTGDQSVSGVQLDLSFGVASSLYFGVDQLLDEDTGAIATEVNSLGDQTDLAQTRIEEMLARLETQRENLRLRFIAMEQAIATMNNILNTLEQQIAALQPRDN